MGDHRAHIKIELTMYGQTRTAAMSINWFPPYGGVCDERVSAWFSETVEELYQTVYSRQIAEAARAQEEREERELYERLRKKFEPCAEGVPETAITEGSADIVSGSDESKIS